MTSPPLSPTSVHSYTECLQVPQANHTLTFHVPEHGPPTASEVFPILGQADTHPLSHLPRPSLDILFPGKPALTLVVRPPTRPRGTELSTTVALIRTAGLPSTEVRAR